MADRQHDFIRFTRAREAIVAFKSELGKGGVTATIRLTRGPDIAAACGQLATTLRGRVPA